MIGRRDGGRSQDQRASRTRPSRSRFSMRPWRAAWSRCRTSHVIRINPPLVITRMKRCAGRHSRPVVRCHRASIRAGMRPRRVLRGAFIGVRKRRVKRASARLANRQGRPDRRRDRIALGRRKGGLYGGLPWRTMAQEVDEPVADKTLDFVDICTPPSSRGTHKRALDAHLHVLCESPWPRG